MGVIFWVVGLLLGGGGPFDGVEPAGSGLRETSVTTSRAAPDGIPPVRIEARSKMGKRFRLTDAYFVLDGAQIAHMTALPKQELDLSTHALEVPLARGQHALTVILVFQGRNVGLFSYLESYRYRTVATYPFYLERAEGQPVIRILARERAGANVPLEKKPTVDMWAPFGFGVTPMWGVNHGTDVTVVPENAPAR